MKPRRLYNRERDSYCRAIRFITGQNGLNYYNNKIDPHNFPSTLCQLCEEEEETTDHLILDCPVLSQLRLDCFGSRFDPEPDNIKPEKLHKFLKSPNLSGIENISENTLLFIKDYENVTHDHPIHNKRAFHLFHMPEDDNDHEESQDPQYRSPKRR